MKSKKLYTKLLLAGSIVLAGASFTSCDDFLTILPTDQLPEENFWQDRSDLDGVRAGAYQQLAQPGQTSKILTWGELRSDNLVLNNMSNTSIAYLQDAILQPSEGMFDWGGFYTGIGYCNLVIEQGEAMTRPGAEVDPSFSATDFRPVRAEMLALRSLYYFYLVRAYRDVPYVTKSIRTDAEARGNMPKAMPGVAILGECIDSLEANVKYAAENYGPAADNKGRFTKLGVHALLADMYLWRGCMLKNFIAKQASLERSNQVNLSDVAKLASDGVTVEGYQTADSVNIDKAYCDKLSAECMKKSIEHSDWVLNRLKADYDKEVAENPYATAEEKNRPYAIFLNDSVGNNVADYAYSMNFGNQNSMESILELQYDGSTTTNGTVNDYLSKYENGEFKPATMALSPTLLSGTSTVDPKIGFGKTDFRLWETCNFGAKENKKPVCKFVARSITIPDITDLVGEASSPSYSARVPGSNDAHWPVYRIADIMLIKAEAIARSTGDANVLREGYRLVNKLFKRNNPGLLAPSSDHTDEEKKLESERVSDRFGLNSDNNFTRNAADLLTLVYRERQREFVGEGKRWFDIVRQAEASNDTKSTLANYISVKSTVMNRLRSLWGFYIPIYNEELKVNGVDHGGNLVQNPVWDRYTIK